MIERIEALIEAATPGPWVFNGNEIYADLEEYDGEMFDVGEGPLISATDDDASFIAHARQLLPLMLEVVKAGEAEHPAQAMSHDPHCHTCWTIERVKAYCAEQLPKR